MIKIRLKLDKKNYLIEMYKTLRKNVQFDYEYDALLDIVSKMYEIDNGTAAEWTIELFNKYAFRGLNDGVDLMNKAKYLIDGLLDKMIYYYKIDEIIRMIHEGVLLYEVRFCLWKELFLGDGKRKFDEWFQKLVDSKQYDEAYKMVKLVVEKQNYISYEIFDVTAFLNDLIGRYTRNCKNIKCQQFLDMLYSLVKFGPDEASKVVLESNFLDYL